MKKKILFTLFFIILGIISLQIQLSPIVEGKGRAFTLFEFLGPTCGMFLNSLWGALVVFSIKFFNALWHGKFTLPVIIGFFTLPLGALYFGLEKNKTLNKLILIVPILAILLFVLHPEGRKAWFFSIFWLIPIFAYFKKERLIFNSLGSTFLAHSIGSVAFLYAFNIPAPVWIALIPVVIIERGCFALGIWASYLLLNNLFEIISQKIKLPILKELVNKNYLVWQENFLRYF